MSISKKLSHLIPKGQEVHLWKISLPLAPNPESSFYYSQILSNEEMKYGASCLTDRKREFLVSRCALRILLSDYFPFISPQEWRFAENDFGKPSVSGPIEIFPLQFNLSHSLDRAVIAFSSAQLLGIDIEQFKGKNSLQAIAAAHFSHLEYEIFEQAMSRSSLSDANFLFFEYWTLKEALIKAIGKGLSIPLDQFSMIIPSIQDQESGIEIKVKFENSLAPEAGFWKFSLIGSETHYRIAVAIRNDEDFPIQIKEVIFDNWGFNAIREKAS